MKDYEFKWVLQDLDEKDREQYDTIHLGYVEDCDRYFLAYKIYNEKSNSSSFKWSAISKLSSSEIRLGYLGSLELAKELCERNARNYALAFRILDLDYVATLLTWTEDEHGTENSDVLYKDLEGNYVLFEGSDLLHSYVSFQEAYDLLNNGSSLSCTEALKEEFPNGSPI